jgi:hypothetical protein
LLHLAVRHRGARLSKKVALQLPRAFRSQARAYIHFWRAW